MVFVDLPRWPGGKYRALEQAERSPTAGKVLDLSPKLNREKWQRENRWTLSKGDLDAIADDIRKRKKAAFPRATQARGVIPKPPAVTWEAKEALKDIQTHIWGINGKIEMLTEPALKGLSFEARNNAKSDFTPGSGEPCFRRWRPSKSEMPSTPSRTASPSITNDVFLCRIAASAISG